MRRWGKASLADWLRATLTLREKPEEGTDAPLARQLGVERCAHCGRTILLGERILWLRNEGRQAALCPLCAEGLRARHVERAA